jgi:N-acetyl-anhydromuramyl-L-alanine amidase AmpD
MQHEPMFHKGQAFAIPCREARNWSRAVLSQHKRWIVLHSMEAPEKGDTAEWCADFFAGIDHRTRARVLAPEASAHYAVDSDHVFCCVEPDRVAWHAPGANQLGVGIEHAGYARQTRAEWLDVFSRPMLELSASLTAYLMRRFQIPLVFVGASQLRSGLGGITTHAECTKAWPEKGGTHTDPGANFPLADYLSMVSEALSRLIEAGAGASA